VSAKFFQELARLGEAMVELPFAAVRRLAEPDGERKVQEAGWRAYDAWVRLMNAATDDLYGDAAFGAATGRSMEGALRWQRMSSAMAGAFFGTLWPAVGLPTAAELTELRAEVRALRDEAGAARLEAAEARAAEFAPRLAAEHPANDSLAAMWDGWVPPAAPFSVGKERTDGPAN
jgi:hypothetical protein